MARTIPGLLAALALPIAALSSAADQQIGDAQVGLELARQVCAECHVVEQEQVPSFYSDAPSFMAIAEIPGMTALAVRVALRTPHRTMPNLVLEEAEIDDIAAYILSLN